MIASLHPILSGRTSCAIFCIANVSYCFFDLLIKIKVPKTNCAISWKVTGGMVVVSEHCDQ